MKIMVSSSRRYVPKAEKCFSFYPHPNPNVIAEAFEWPLDYSRSKTFAATQQSVKAIVDHFVLSIRKYFVNI